MENELLENLGRLHTTELGVIRIKKNLTGMESTKIKKSLKSFVFKDFSFFAKPSEKKKPI